MKLKDLLTSVAIKDLHHVGDQEIKNISVDSRLAGEGVLFVAVRGASQNGHDFLDDACANGCSGVVVDDPGRVPKGFRGAVITVEDTRSALTLLAKIFYGEPSRRLLCVGVTGTNGKTTTTGFLESILNLSDRPCAIMGTVEKRFKNKSVTSHLTTPGPIELQKTLKDFRDWGALAVVMEVSSHALDQGRAHGVEFDGAVFTNLSRDHLDYHGDLETYFSAKRRLFSDLLYHSQKSKKLAAINVDCEYGARLAKEVAVEVLTFGIQNPADVEGKILSEGFDGTRAIFSFKGQEIEIHVPLPSRHNVMNALAASALAFGFGVPLEKIKRGVETLNSVRGRLEPVRNNKGVFVFVDYAHTPDALEKVLKSLGDLRKVAKGKNKIITVFGCGGDRDRGKRPEMGRIAAELSDHVFVTSDNPRTENPHSIIEEILEGVPSELRTTRVEVQEDRKEAIEQAIALSKEGDVILIAGKGHEDYQIIGTQKHDFDDVKVAKEFL